jgi:hypothetical protein
LLPANGTDAADVQFGERRIGAITVDDEDGGQVFPSR